MGRHKKIEIKEVERYTREIVTERKPVLIARK